MKPRFRARPAVLALAGLLFLAAATASAAGTVDEGLFKEIEANLMCTDGCGMALQSCDNATAEKMRTELRAKLSEGATKEQIYAYMISVYGEEVMAAPPPRNALNIIAWVLPFVALLAGGAGIYVAVDRWVFERRHAPRPDEQDVDDAELAAYDEILDEEVKKRF